MPFSEIKGQDRALGALRASLERGALHHAYLFAGPEGVGKATAARLLAQAANCEADAAARPCGACPPCRKIARGTHPDVFLLAEERAMAKAGRWEPKGGRTPSKDIVVDQIRDVVDHRLAMKRFEGRRRFIIVDPADAMNVPAQNALLKTLEEPPDDTTLVLVAAAPDALLPTVRSRCARVAFAPLADDLVAERLAALQGLDGEAARAAAALAGGSLGRALALDAKALEAREAAVAAAAALDPGDASAWLGYAAAYARAREPARELCLLLEVWLRDVLAVQGAGAAAPLALADLHPATEAAAAALAPADVLRRVDAVRDAAEALLQNGSPALAVERMLIRWFHGDVR
ncbi:MAG: DNA polymerase III subunit delta' [Anaeromyxobacteraceae bacterium]